MGNIGITEILLIVVVIVIIFGSSQIPKVAKAIGEGLKEFKKGVKEAKKIDEDDDKKETKRKNSSIKRPAAKPLQKKAPKK
jgi:sec-independent protein translocase protein TatA